MAKQACRRQCFFKSKKDMPFSKRSVVDNGVFTNTFRVCWFFKTPNRPGAQRHHKWRLGLVLSSHLDPVGNQNHVQYLSISWLCCLHLVLYLHTVLHTVVRFFWVAWTYDCGTTESFRCCAHMAGWSYTPWLQEGSNADQRARWQSLELMCCKYPFPLYNL